MLATISLLLFGAVTTNAAVAGKWAYDEPGNDASHWPDYYAECGYSRQSPIDLPDYNYECNSNDAPLEIQWTSQPSSYAIRNTGYSLLAMPFEINHNGGSDLSQLEILHHSSDTNIRLQNSFYRTYESGISKEYCFDSLHFHWGKTNADGSEHTVGGESFPLEVHLVHYSCDYNLAGDAINDYATGQSDIKYDDDNVLAVIGVIFEIGKANPVLDKILDDIIIDGVSEIKQPDSETKLEFYYTDFDVKWLLPESREFVGYLGSLTTPPCFETVRWHVLKERMTVSEEQMDKFRSLLSADATSANDTQSPNFRPVMPLNDRTIYKCKHDIEDEALFDDNAEKDAFLGITTDTETGTDTNTDTNTGSVSGVTTEEESAEAAGTVMSESEITWRMLGVAFVCLFMVTLVILMIALICLCKNWDNIMNGPRRKSSLKHAKLEEEDHRQSVQDVHVVGHSGNVTR